MSAKYILQSIKGAFSYTQVTQTSKSERQRQDIIHDALDY